MNVKSLSMVNVSTFSDDFSRSYLMLSRTAHTVFSATIGLAQLRSVKELWSQLVQRCTGFDEHGTLFHNPLWQYIYKYREKSFTILNV